MHQIQLLTGRVRKPKFCCEFNYDSSFSSCLVHNTFLSKYILRVISNKTQDAVDTGYKHTVEATPNGIRLLIEGYSDVASMRAYIESIGSGY